MLNDYLNIKTIPKAKDRPRFSYKTKVVYTSRKTSGYENFLKCHFIKYMIGKEVFTGPVAIDIWFFTDKAKKTNDKTKHCPAKKPDIDNLAKAVLDAANKIVFEDDSQIVDLTLHKRYSDDKHQGIYFSCVSMTAASVKDIQT